ncbi:MAG: aspartate dehydrogenase [Alphaproteobacteria bacterium]|nr:aspartate dehydrogenase [Alphaproteobacteria bacterium]
MNGRSAATTTRTQFGVIGYGAITREIVRVLARQGETGRIAGVLVRPTQEADRRAEAAGRFPVLTDARALAGRAQLVLECAGHAAVAEHGGAILAGGSDLVVAAVGALTDPALVTRLRAGARGAARILIPSGAVAGIDGLIAARTAGLRRVVYISAKPPEAWRGTPAERVIDLARIGTATTFFEASAREAARAYPQNANVGATVALAGLGLDATRVRLVADPALAGPLGVIDAEGDFGMFKFDILAYAAPENPKTSLLTAHSMLAAADHGVAFALPDDA